MPPYYRLQTGNPPVDRFYNHLLSILVKAFNGWFEVNGECCKRGWTLTGSTLAYFMMNFSLVGCKEIHVECAGEIAYLTDRLIKLGMVPISPHVFRSLSGIRIILHRVKSIPQTIEVYPADYDRSKVQLPAKIGTTLDNFDINWIENTRRNPKPERTGIFFDAQRRRNGHEFMQKMLECGERAGIRDKMFLAFGNALGYAIMGDFLPNDNDIDMNILADGIPQEQRHQYLMECKKAGLCENRMRGPAMLEGKYAWFSIGNKSPYTEHGVKSCNWFWFKHGGYWWHSKGSKWIGRKSLSDKHPTAKGIPTSVFTGEFKPVIFGGVEINAPKYLGKCLDWWYGDWTAERVCSSTINTVLVMPKENDRKTWYITNK
jgi:hypothetical protein